MRQHYERQYRFDCTPVAELTLNYECRDEMIGQSASLLIDQFPNALYSVAFSPQGEVFAVSGGDSVVHVYDASTYTRLWDFDTEQGEVNQATFGPAGDTLATVGDDGTVQIWDRVRRKKLRSIRAHHDLAFNSVFSSDGRTLITCGRDAKIHIWNAANGERKSSLEGHDDAVHQIAITGDGLLASCSDDGTVRLWDLATAQQLAVFLMETKATSCAISSDCQLLAAADEDGWLRVWNLENRSLRSEFELLDHVHSLCFSSDSWMVACGDRSGVVHWVDLAKNTVVKSRRLHTDRVYGVRFAPNGKTVLSVARDGQLRSCAVSNGFEVSQTLSVNLRHPVWVNLPDDRAPDGQRLVAMGKDARHRGIGFVDPLSLKMVRFDADELRVPFSLSADGRYLTRVVGLNQIRTCRIEDSSDQASWNADVRISVVATSHDGNRVAAFDSEQRLHVFERGKDNGVVTGWTRGVGNELAFSPTENILAYVSENVIDVVDLESNTRLATLEGHSARTRDLEFHPDGLYLASASSDRTIRLWDSRSGAERGRLDGHLAGVACVRFADGGRTIVSSDTRALYFWHAATQQLFFSHSFTAPQANSPQVIESFAISPASDRIAIRFANAEATCFIDLTDQLEGSFESLTRSDHKWRLRATAEVNGDGREDIVAIDDMGAMVALSTSDGFGKALRWLDFGDEKGQTDAFSWMLGDVNGDGMDDIVRLSEGRAEVSLSTGKEFSSRQWSQELRIADGVDPSALGDVDGDGCADLVAFLDTGVVAALSLGDAFAAATNWSKAFCRQAGWNPAKHICTLADVNGDGKADLIGFGGDEVVAAISNGSAFMESDTYRTDGFGYNAGWRVEKHPRRLADINGGGREDIVGFGEYVLTAFATESSFVMNDAYMREFGYRNDWRVDKHPRLLADVNGDGLSDIVAFDELGVWVSLSTASGFAAMELWSPDFASRASEDNLDDSN